MKNRHACSVPIFVILIMPFPLFGGHALAPGYTCTYIQTTRDDAFYIHSPGINYTGHFRTGPFRIYISTSVLLPLWGRQDKHNFYHPNYYSHYTGTDLFLGMTRDSPVTARHEVTPVLGWHVSGIRLRGKPEFVDFYSLTMGFGLKLMTRYQGSWNLINCAFLSFSYDCIDLLYKNNKLKRGHTISLGFGRSF